MSIGTDVARIKGNITAALAAIADKGVTVPDGSTSDALAGLIASIEAGSGGGGYVFDSGVYVPASDIYCTSSLESVESVEVGMNITPFFTALLMKATSVSTAQIQAIVSTIYNGASYILSIGYSGSVKYPGMYKYFNYINPYMNDILLNKAIPAYGLSSSYRLTASSHYSWLAIGEESSQ